MMTVKISLPEKDGKVNKTKPAASGPPEALFYWAGGSRVPILQIFDKKNIIDVIFNKKGENR